MEYIRSWIRAIRQGTKTAYREAELLARLRALRHEAIIARNWDATDKRIRWEKDCVRRSR